MMKKKTSLFVLLTILMMACSPKENEIVQLSTMETRSSGADIPLSSWLEAVPNYAPVAKLSLPGTHDAGAYKYGGAMVITQDLTIEQQLQAGIRAMDIRLGAVNNDHLDVYHGFVSQGLNFESDVLTKVIQFLNANPSETVVITLRKETDDKNSPRGYVSILREILEKSQYQPYIANNFTANMTLGQLRGKILFLSRDNIGQPYIGGEISGWADNTSFSRNIAGNNNAVATLHVEDYYKVASLLPGSIHFKINEINKNLVLATNAVNNNNWFITFTSGTGIFAYPNAVAARVNKPVADYITNNNLQSCGIVLMDFAGWNDSKALTKAIIDCNFRLYPSH